MKLKDTSRAVAENDALAVVDSQGDLWFFNGASWASQCTDLPIKDLEKIKTLYGVDRYFYEGDELTVIL